MTRDSWFVAGDRQIYVSPSGRWYELREDEEGMPCLLEPTEVFPVQECRVFEPGTQTEPGLEDDEDAAYFRRWGEAAGALREAVIAQEPAVVDASSDHEQWVWHPGGERLPIDVHQARLLHAVPIFPVVRDGDQVLVLHQAERTSYYAGLSRARQGLCLRIGITLRDVAPTLGATGAKA